MDGRLILLDYNKGNIDLLPRNISIKIHTSEPHTQKAYTSEKCICNSKKSVLKSKAFYALSEVCHGFLGRILGSERVGETAKSLSVIG